MLTRFPTIGAVLVVAAAALAAGLTAPGSAQARVCSVLDEHPCVYHPFHQVCGVFRHRPCTPPEFEYPFSEQLQLTIESRDRESDSNHDGDEAERGAPQKLGTIRAVFAALRSCWVPPPMEESRPGTQLAVRLSFKRSGELFGRPRVTYVTPGLPGRLRQAYWEAVEAAIDRCAPLAFTTGLGGALAGRPFAIRFIDKRSES